MTSAGCLSSPGYSVGWRWSHPRCWSRSRRTRRAISVPVLSGSDEIWTSNADGSNATQLIPQGLTGSPHWSPDGRRIAFDSSVKGTFEIFAMSSQGGQAQQLTEASVNIRPNWSHDGKWIYFVSHRTGVTRSGSCRQSVEPPFRLTRTGGEIPSIGGWYGDLLPCFRRQPDQEGGAGGQHQKGGTGRQRRNQTRGWRADLGQ